mmetsp:Transcript_20700/g.42656  ORF Transcript_20700/g.42656 Transcript_20700/m.42656 type:complete len:393 (+) Transcript_20700:71-1249(+)
MTKRSNSRHPLLLAAASVAAIASPCIFLSAIWDEQGDEAPTMLRRDPTVLTSQRRLANVIKDPKTVATRKTVNVTEEEEEEVEAKEEIGGEVGVQVQVEVDDNDDDALRFAVLLTSSNGFFDLWLNWLAFFERLAIPDLPVYLFAEDNATHARCVELSNQPREPKSSESEPEPEHHQYQANITCLPWDFVFEQSEAVDSLGAYSYRNKDYNAMMTHRPAIVKALLEMDRHLIFSDSDVVWLKDPLPYIRTSFKATNPKVHILGQQAYKYGNHICPGFTVYRACPEVVELVELWQEDLLSKEGPSTNQGPFNKILDQVSSQGISVTLQDGTTELRKVTPELLRKELFPNGDLYFRQMTDEERKEALVVHNNFITGYEQKIDRFKKFNLWALEA